MDKILAWMIRQLKGGTVARFEHPCFRERELPLYLGSYFIPRIYEDWEEDWEEDWKESKGRF